jgi:zinc protease
MTSRLRWPIALSALVFAAVVSLAAPATATEVQRVVSPGGIEAWLVEEHAIPILSLEIVFRGGASLEPADRGGLANMTSALLDEGAGDMDSQTFQTRLEDLAIHLGFSGGRDDFSGSLKTLAENTDAAFEMLGLALAAPRFDEAPVERIRRQLLIGLARKAEDPDTIAARAWFEAAFPDHAYGRPREGTPESVAAITAEDLRGYVAAQFARDRMLIGVVGDITAERLGPLLDSTFGSLPAIGASLDMTPVEPAISGRQIVIERDIPQSVVIFGHKGIARDDPDFYGAYAMNHILGGGGFGSRLTTEVREKRGLAYGVYSYFSPMDRAALFLGRVATQNERVAESLDVIRAEIARMRDDGVSAGELADAKTYLTGSFPLRLDSNDKIARFLVSIQLQDLGIDYIDRRNGYIEAVTLDDVNRLARELLNPEQLQVVIVGKPDGLTATD